MPDILKLYTRPQRDSNILEQGPLPLTAHDLDPFACCEAPDGSGYPGSFAPSVCFIIARLQDEVGVCGLCGLRDAVQIEELKLVGRRFWRGIVGPINPVP
jgi:hypothetical protein